MPAGIYTSRYKWKEIMRDSQDYSDLPLWDAWYSHEDIDDFIPYGGWGRCTMRQYSGSTLLENVLVDLNVYRREPQ